MYFYVQGTPGYRGADETSDREFDAETGKGGKEWGMRLSRVRIVAEGKRNGNVMRVDDS